MELELLKVGVILPNDGQPILLHFNIGLELHEQRVRVQPNEADLADGSRVPELLRGYVPKCGHFEDSEAQTGCVLLLHFNETLLELEAGVHQQSFDAVHCEDIFGGRALAR